MNERFARVRDFLNSRKVRRFAQSTFALLLIAGLLTTYFEDYLAAQAATYTWAQTNWSGGTDSGSTVSSATKSTWYEYSLASSTLALSSSAVQLGTTVSTTTVTTTADFNTNTPTNSQTSVSSNSVILALSSAATITKVREGANFGIALKSDGTVYVWGSASNGELGNGQTTGSYLPTQVSLPTTAVDVAAGNSHALVALSDGTAYSWGYNSKGQLGDGTITQRATPGQVSGITGVSAVAAGNNVSYALKSDGTVYSWGDNSYGKLGLGYNSSTIYTPTLSAFPTGITKIAATNLAGNDVYALKSDGTVWSAGYGVQGQLGNGTIGNTNNTPVEVCAVGQTSPCSVFLTGITSISAGYNHALALKSDGTVYGWGDNSTNQLGGNVGTKSTVPVEIQDSAGTGYLSGATHVSAGYAHSAAVTSGGVYTLGNEFKWRNKQWPG